MNIEAQILKLIEESLPEKEVGVVRRIIEERDEFREENKFLEESKEATKELNIELVKELDTLKKEARGVVEIKEANKKKSEELAVLEKELIDREIKLGVSLATARADIYQHCFDAITKVPTIRKSIQKTIPVEKNGYTQHETHNTEEQTKEE